MYMYLCVYVCVCMPMCIYIYICTYIYVHIHVYIRKCLDGFTSVHLWVAGRLNELSTTAWPEFLAKSETLAECEHLWIDPRFIYICVYIYIYIHIFICVHIYIYIYTFNNIGTSQICRWLACCLLNPEVSHIVLRSLPSWAPEKFHQAAIIGGRYLNKTHRISFQKKKLKKCHVFGFESNGKWRKKKRNLFWIRINWKWKKRNNMEQLIMWSGL